MTGYVSTVKFCQMSGIDRGNLHKRLKKEGVATIKAPYLTASGVQDVTWIPQDWVDKVMARHAAAETARGEIVPANLAICQACTSLSPTV